MIPRQSSWCVRCTAPEGFGMKPGELCDHHRGSDGKPVLYDGAGAYEPSDFVTSVVGNSYRAWDGRTYECVGYDPRSGFLMRTDDDQPPSSKSISERAIGRTYHRIQRSL